MKKFLTTAAAVAIAASAAQAQDVTLRIQTHYTSESFTGGLYQKWVDDIEVMSGGAIDVEMFWSSSVVATTETWDAAVNGILDCDMTGGSYQSGKNKAFQFVGDLMGGYDDAWQMFAWLYWGGGEEPTQSLYNEYGMELIGWFVYGPESFASTAPIASLEDFKGWKFRSPPGLETEIMSALGASPIVMDFTEVFTALETGIIDGADASNVANNRDLGLYDIAKHSNYPGFHSMPMDHLACNAEVWNGLSDQHRRIIETATQKLSLQIGIGMIPTVASAVVELTDEGVTFSRWSDEDVAEFRAFAQDAWEPWGDATPEARAILDSHKSFMKTLGILKD